MATRPSSSPTVRCSSITVRQVHADLLILDIMMPGLNGFEIYDKVREDPDIRNMPVLFVSAAAAQFEAGIAKRKISNVIAKPFDLNDLLDRCGRSARPTSRERRGLSGPAERRQAPLV